MRTFAFCSYGENLPWQGGLPGVVQRVTHLSKLPGGNKKTHVNSNRRQTVHPGKVNLGVIDFPRGVTSCPCSCEQALRQGMFNASFTHFDR